MSAGSHECAAPVERLTLINGAPLTLTPTLTTGVPGWTKRGRIGVGGKTAFLGFDVPVVTTLYEMVMMIMMSDETGLPTSRHMQ